MEINWKQIEQETGIRLDKITTKGDIITFEGIKKEEEERIRSDLENNVNVWNRINNKDIMNKLNGMEFN